MTANDPDASTTPEPRADDAPTTDASTTDASATGSTQPSLGTDDAQAIDVLVEHGFDTAAAIAAAPALRGRILAAAALFERASSAPVEPPDPSLIDATMARIARAEAERESRMRIDPQPAAPQGRNRWGDFIAVACVALLVFSLGSPLLSQLRHRQEMAGCATNMREVGSALAQYAADFDGRPLVAGLAPDLSRLSGWTGYDNSRHLDLLHERGYCGKDCLCCANDSECEGYASQVPSTPMDRYWRQPAHVPLLADRNPFIVRTFLGQPIASVLENSPDHGGFGQNVLFADLAVMFEPSPIITIRIDESGQTVEENIWIPADQSGRQDRLLAPGEWKAIDVFLMQ